MASNVASPNTVFRGQNKFPQQELLAKVILFTRALLGVMLLINSISWFLDGAHIYIYIYIYIYMRFEKYPYITVLI